MARELEALLGALAGQAPRAEALASGGERGPPPRAMLGASLALRGGALPHPYHAHHRRQLRPQPRPQPQGQQEVFETPLYAHSPAGPPQWAQVPPQWAPGSAPGAATALALTGNGDAWGWADNQHQSPPPSPPPPRAPLASVAAALENLRRIEGFAAASNAGKRIGQVGLA